MTVRTESYKGNKVLEKIVENFRFFKQSPSDKSIVPAGDIEQLNDKSEHVFVCWHYVKSL